MLDLLFDRLNLGIGSEQRQFTLYGHSAGAAFAHRYLAFAPKARVQQAIFANCGWYTFPDATQPMPFGLNSADLQSDRLRAFLETPVTLLVGDRDLGGPYPGWWPEGFAAQGAHRVARSLRFLEVARHRAERLNARFCWRWQAVPGAAHENAKMIGPAVRILAEGWSTGGERCP